MIEGIHVSSEFVAFSHRHLSLRLFLRTVPGASALALSLLAGAGALSGPAVTAVNVGEAPAVAEARVPASARAVIPNPFGAMLVDLRARSRSTSASLKQSAPPEAKPEPVLSASIDASTPTAVIPAAEDLPPKSAAPVFQLGESAPLPPRRPPEFGSSANLNPPQAPARLSAQQMRAQSRRTAVAVPAGDDRSFFEKLFGGAPQSSSSALGYAPAEGGVTIAARSVVSGSNPLQRYDRYTAVYDISAHTVYLPNGMRLEAHSGLGARLDDPHYVHERMRGATPPSLYELTPREQLFHGVQALRLTPVSGNVYGRAGLLAHTYMLGPNGDSNGCVSFRNYQAFLQAYQNGEVKRLAVVASLN
jgi:hypothetical protein